MSMTDQNDVLRIDSKDGEPSYDFDLRRVHVDLFHLLSIVLSDEKIAHVLNGDEDPLWDLCSVAESEIARILVTSAVVARISDEQRGFALLHAEDQCGELRKDNESEQSEPLILREACNKIIHAKEIQFDIKHSVKNYYSIVPVVYLFGEKNGKTWEAKLDLVEYIRSFVNRVREIEEKDT